MNFKTRKLVSPPDLNPAGTLFGGELLKWIDEEIAIFAMCQLNTNHVVTKYVSEINFTNPAYNGDIVEIGAEVISLGNTSVTCKCEVRIKGTDVKVITIEKIVFVHVDINGRPKPHGLTMEELDKQ